MRMMMMTTTARRRYSFMPAAIVLPVLALPSDSGGSNRVLR